MKIDPINQPQTSTNFKSRIVKNDFLDAGYKLIGEALEAGSLKDLNQVKSFYDSLALIKANKAAKTIWFERSKDGAHAIVDGSRMELLKEQNNNIQPGYLAIQAVKLYAEKLGFPAEKTVLDSCQQNIIKKTEELESLRKAFATHLKGMLNDITKS